VGLKEGVLDELVLKHFELWDAGVEAQGVLDACTRLGRRYQFDEAHGQTVMAFAASIFDDMQAVHTLGPRDRLLLQAAALLHDIGDFVRYDAHHKHTYYLVLHSDIIGLTPEERAIVANVARYHRKSLPDRSHNNFRDLEQDARERVRALAAILRVADALDREHRGKIHLVRAAVVRNEKDKAQSRLVLTLTGEEGRELEEWTLRAKADLMRDVFDLDVALA
jgi:exopolyphosphatase/guanosine-5'-triphosphate,3'-diphosphate pyrophosphatase